MAISSGAAYTCGLKPDGVVVCWGLAVTPPPGGERFVAISSGLGHVCGLRPDGSAVCWGLDSVGQASPPEGERFAIGQVDAGG